MAVIAWVWPFNVRTGTAEAVDDESVGGSAGRIVSVKSAPAVNRTREEGKKRREVSVLKCNLGILRKGGVAPGAVALAVEDRCIEPS